jgi:hypothetical protein
VRAFAQEQIYNGTDELIRYDPDQPARLAPLQESRHSNRIGPRQFLIGAGSVRERTAVKRSIIVAEMPKWHRSRDWVPAVRRSTFVYLQLIDRSRVMVVVRRRATSSIPWQAEQPTLRRPRTRAR